MTTVQIPGTMRGKVIVQVSDTPLYTIQELLPSYHQSGVTHIQISPVQGIFTRALIELSEHCPHIRAWYRVYQPTGVRVSNSIGNEQSLTELITAAKQYRIGIIVDVVLHHKTGCPLCNPKALFFLPTFLSDWLKSMMAAYNLRERPETRRFGCYDWGPPQNLQDPNVLEETTEFLVGLLEMGVAGFRFDAAKHIKPDILQGILKNAVNRSKTSSDLYSYSEVLDSQPWVCEEYLLSDDPIFTVSDYPRTFALMGALSPGGDLRYFLESQHSWWSWKSVCIADSHDSMEGHSYSFYDEREGILAVGILLAIGSGTPMIYHSHLTNSVVSAGIAFYHLTFGEGASCGLNSTPDFLVIRRGDSSFALVNKSFEWMKQEAFQVDCLREGKYIELQYNFSVWIQRGDDGSCWISSWGGGKGGIEIGPRNILYLVRVVEDQ